MKIRQPCKSRLPLITLIFITLSTIIHYYCLPSTKEESMPESTSNASSSTSSTAPHATPTEDELDKMIDLDTPWNEVRHYLALVHTRVDSARKRIMTRYAALRHSRAEPGKFSALLRTIDRMESKMDSIAERLEALYEGLVRRGRGRTHHNYVTLASMYAHTEVMLQLIPINLLRRKILRRINMEILSHLYLNKPWNQQEHEPALLEPVILISITLGIEANWRSQQAQALALYTSNPTAHTQHHYYETYEYTLQQQAKRADGIEQSFRRVVEHAEKHCRYIDPMFEFELLAELGQIRQRIQAQRAMLQVARKRGSLMADFDLFNLQ